MDPNPYESPRDLSEGPSSPYWIGFVCLGALAGVTSVMIAVTIVIALIATESLFVWLVVATLSGVAAAFAAMAFYSGTRVHMMPQASSRKVA
jgi:hypothetical protein